MTISNDKYVRYFQLGNNRFNGYIPMNNITVTYSRSSGPGGQNVNKLDTKVDVRFHVESAEWISEVVRERLLVRVKYIKLSLLDLCKTIIFFYF